MDAISCLPEDVLGRILSLLPTKEAASTSVLSKKWKYLFRLVDNFNFDDSLSLVRTNDKGKVYVFSESFKNFVDGALALQYDSPPIKKLSLTCHVGRCSEPHKDFVGLWISNAVGRNVLELDLMIKNRYIDHFLLYELFTSKTLVKLSLGVGLYLGKLPSFVSLPSLKSLFFDEVYFIAKEDFNVLLAGCIALEELSYKKLTMPYTISSMTVKRLVVDYFYPNSYFNGRDNNLSLDLPNLLYLDFSGYNALFKNPLVKLDSLVEAKLDLRSIERLELTTLFSGIRNVEILHLSRSSIDVINTYFRIGLLHLPVFENLVSLSFGSENKRGGWKLLAYILKQSPKLETLIVQDLNGYNDHIVPMSLNQVKVLHILDFGESDKYFRGNWRAE